MERIPQHEPWSDATATDLRHTDICTGQVVAFYLFDVSETADLGAIPQLIGAQGVRARLAPKPSTPPYVQYETPPLSFDGAVLGVPAIGDFRTRLRLFDYGVASIALTRTFHGSWAEFTTLGATLIESPYLEAEAERLCRSLVDKVRPALTAPRQDYLSEDYVVFAVHDLDRPMSGDELLEERGLDIASMLRGERQPLSKQEIATVLRHHLSYLSNDLVVPTWNAAFVYDTPAGTQAALEILEFANSQLLEFRHYDQLLDRQLTAIYAGLDHPRRFDQWLGSRYTRAARQVQSLLIDVNELTDRTENAVKFIGDIYAVRLFRLAADRLGLASWKAEVQSKLQTMDDIYRFAVEQTGMSRGTFLEATIVAILILELVLLFLGIRP